MKCHHQWQSHWYVSSSSPGVHLTGMYANNKHCPPKIQKGWGFSSLPTLGSCIFHGILGEWKFWTSSNFSGFLEPKATSYIWKNKVTNFEEMITQVFIHPLKCLEEKDVLKLLRTQGKWLCGYLVHELPCLKVSIQSLGSKGCGDGDLQCLCLLT